MENSEVATYQAGLAALRDPDSNLSPEHKAKLAADLGVHHEPPSAGEVREQQVTPQAPHPTAAVTISPRPVTSLLLLQMRAAV